MYVIDTNVVSELRRASVANANVVAWIDSVDRQTLFASAIMLHELEVGILRKERRDPAQGVIFRQWLTLDVIPMFEGRILAVDGEIAQLSARFLVPDPLSLQDALIAATALVHGMTVVTRNVPDFARAGVRLLNPWEPQSS